MKLASVLSPDFDSAVRSRGMAYFRQGAVHIRAGSASAVEARVSGSRTYNVDLTWDGRKLTLFCDCPYFESEGPCKHLWATILASDARSHLANITWLDRSSIYYEDSLDGSDDKLFGGFDDDDLDELETYLPPLPRRGLPPTFHPPVPKAPVVPIWQQQIRGIAPSKPAPGLKWPSNRELLYLIDVPGSVTGGAIVLALNSREPKKNGGGWKKPVVPRLTRSGISQLPDPADRQILSLLTASGTHSYWMMSTAYDTPFESFRLLAPLSTTAMRMIAATGRCMLRRSATEDMRPLAWDDGEPWQFQLRVQRDSSRSCAITGHLRRGGEEMELSKPVLIAEGLVIADDRIALLEEGTSREWLDSLRRLRRIEAPAAAIEQVVADLVEHPLPAPLDLPEDLRYEEVRAAPRPSLTIRSVKRSWQADLLRAELSFNYEGRLIPDSHTSRGLYDAAARRFLVRDADAERAARQLLLQNGASDYPQDYLYTTPAYKLSPKKLPAVARVCLQAGWHLEAEGKIFRKPGEVRMSVASGVDWFELHGEVNYGDATAKLPALLAALRRGENMVRLDDGTYGLLPEEWLQRFSQFAGMGAAEEDHVRFRRNQAGLLDALLATQPEVSCDETFARVRQELRTFDGIHANEQPPGFQGQLRDYQREGLGWMEFLRRFGFGGCLADDMGVGKTAQVLALLEHRRVMRASAGGSAGSSAPNGPSLVVVPRSLIFNWKQESARFTPQLRVLDHTGLDRNFDGIANHDVVLTTYGTLRRDAATFKDLEFDYVVLDEAQAIKNAGTESAKAARLLRGRHRLALSGTPVENHLGELWSIFEFLNPGMLGAASVFQLAGGAARNPSEETRTLLAHALRPFILRRTKEQVARELPPKSEQTIFCEMKPAQRKLYDELRKHYRDTLLGKIAKQGLAKSKIQVLEALLRLRQAACHPGLIDAKRREDPSAKLDVLTSRLTEVVSEGHKALVFSQFTSLLSIVREQLDKDGIVYEYLDGATRDRQACVERFQTDPNCGIFLISLKAGGLGLNLTAAEYVFLLDPWWNPAVEAQAVDRAHRIGQMNQVFAYRLIARDTVEEKILKLQESKRDLAAAIISADNSVIRNLKTEDLELLLS